MSASGPRIVMLHATPVAMAPVTMAMASLWPEAEAVDLLDTGLTVDRAAEGPELSEELTERFVALGRYGERAGADGVLVTCSAFGPAIDRMEAELTVPVLRPNEAMFRQAVRAGGRVAMLATFAPAVATMEEEFRRFAEEAALTTSLDTVLVPGAIDRLRGGDGETHDRLLAEAAPQVADHDAIMLAHFSTSRAADRVREAVGAPVLAAPEAAVRRMRELVGSPAC